MSFWPHTYSTALWPKYSGSSPESQKSELTGWKKHVSICTFIRLDTRLFPKRGTADRQLIQRTFELTVYSPEPVCCRLVIWKLESSGCSVVWRTFLSPLEITDKMNPYFVTPGPGNCLWNNHSACSNKWYFYVSIRQTDGASDRPQSNNTTCWQSIQPAGIRCASWAQYRISDRKWCNTTTGLKWSPWRRRRDSKSSGSFDP